MWTTRLLADRYVVLGVAEGWLTEPVSREAVRVTLEKNALRPHRVRGWVIPPGQDAAFVAPMERVLDVYAEPYDAARPVVCLDERPCALVGEGRPPLPMRPGADQR